MIDDGPVLATVDVPILATDTLETLAARIHTAEHALLVDVLVSLCSTSLRSPATQAACGRSLAGARSLASEGTA